MRQTQKARSDLGDRTLLFSVTREDFDLQTFRCGGNGGQKVNKTSSGVRLIHRASGARGESREERSFEQNRRNAFRRLVETPTFKAWHRMEVARRTGQEAELEARVREQMDERNLVVEVKDEEGRWVPERS